MSKRYNIRWTDADSKELARVVKNFNAKISRLEKKNPQQKNALPERVSVKQIKDLVTTRNDLKRELNSLSRFSQKGAEKIVTAPDNYYNLQMTNWQKKEMTRRTAVINRKRDKRREMIADVDLTSRGKKVGYKKGNLGMGKADQVALEPMNAFTHKMTRADLRMKFKNILRESQEGYWMQREQLLKENYIKSLEQNFREKDIKDVIKKIDNMDFREFYKVFQAEGGNFEASYPPDAEQYEQYVSDLKSIWTPNIKKG